MAVGRVQRRNMTKVKARDVYILVDTCLLGRFWLGDDGGVAMVRVGRVMLIGALCSLRIASYRVKA
jgi:hypothetical protein